MPLNLKDSEESKQTNNVKKEPILHKPKQDLTAVSKIILWIVAVIVIGGGMYALFKFGIIGKKKEPFTEPVMTQSIDTITTSEQAAQATTPQGSIHQAESKPIIESKTPEKKIEPQHKRETMHTIKEVQRQMGKGSYTIFIGSFTSKEKAEKEAARWNKDKIIASVGEFEVQGNVVYRICYGHFTSHDEAKKEAEDIKDKLKSGYWIGKIK